MPRPAVLLAAAAPFALAAGCAAARQLAALRQVRFVIERASQVELAGLRLDHVRSLAELSPRDGARLATAVFQQDVPLSFTIHLSGENPAENAVTARMARVTWTLLLNGRETVSGAVDTTYTFPPGQPTEVRIPVRLDLYRFYRTSARDAFDLALGLLGQAGRQTDVALTAVPVIDTPLGAISYPGAITIVRRTVGGEAPR
jgi:hypothetical protein